MQPEDYKVEIRNINNPQGVESKDEGAGDDYYSYEYASAEETTDTGSGGQRLVGAARKL